jgi:dihydrofolate reductase
MSVSIIVAASLNGVIGRDRGLPWHIPEDLKWFKSLTMGHSIIMGRRTYESLGRLLPGRTSIVVTRDRRWTLPGGVVVHSLPEALRAAAGDPEAFVIGGAELFDAAMDFADRVYLTRVLIECPGDTFFPLERLDAGWRRVRVGPDQVSPKQQIPFRHEVYERVWELAASNP